MLKNVKNVRNLKMLWTNGQWTIGPTDQQTKVKSRVQATKNLDLNVLVLVCRYLVERSVTKVTLHSVVFGLHAGNLVDDHN